MRTTDSKFPFISLGSVKVLVDVIDGVEFLSWQYAHSQFFFFELNNYDVICYEISGIRMLFCSYYQFITHN